MVDQVLSLEHEELEALVALLEERPTGRSLELDNSSMYCSDEEDFDSIFADLLNEHSNDDSRCNARQAARDIKREVEDDEAMDTAG